jgi:hypothetical protein
MEPRLLFATGAITGYVFNDTDVSGKKTFNEPGLANWRAYIDADNDARLDFNEKSVPTSSSGAFNFTRLNPGTYRIRVVEQTGWRRTGPAAGSFLVTVPITGGTLSGYTFGYTRKTIVGGTVFNDLNGNGWQNSGERGLSGWQVYCDKNRNGRYDYGEPADTTDYNGHYQLVVDSGYWKFRVTVPPRGWDRRFAGDNFAWYIPPATEWYIAFPQRQTA